MHVRFAPSPTGYLHVGNIRSCIINYLFALKNNAKFFLRIDDTDLERSKPEYQEAIYEDLKWLNIRYDKTFNQSDRFNRYNEIAKILIEKGHLYPCYETQEELELKRKIQLNQGKPPLYDRSALNYSDAELKRFSDEGRKPHYRFKLPDGEVSWVDIVRGKLTFNPRTMSDPILIREDQTYPYTLPSVIDDIDYDITHIFRGEDHISNTAVQIPIFKTICALLGKDFSLEFGHTSFLVGPKGEKLSKRLGSISIRDLRLDNCEYQTIVSLIALLGTPHNIDIALEINDLLPDFDVKNYGGSAAKFDPLMIEALNEKLFQKASLEWVNKNIQETTLTEAQWQLVKFNIKKRNDIVAWENIFSGTIDEALDIDANFAKTALDLLPDSWDGETWGIWTNAIKEKTGLKGKQLFMPLRQMITGLEHGPEMKLFLPLIKRDLAVARIKSHLPA